MILNHFPNIKGLIIDMDGVLWRDTEPLGDLPAIMEKIKQLNLKMILATNNATRTVEEYHQKLAHFGVVLEDWQIINSAQAAGIFLREKYKNRINVYVVGQPSLKNTLNAFGLSIVNEDETDVQVVVASLDYQLNYEKLKHASLLVQSGSEFIGTNPDATFPTPEGLNPGSGTIIGALEIATGKKAIMMGKPEPLLYKMALNRLQLSPQETLAIGDRLETDIKGADAAGIHSALVLTGVSTRAQAKKFKPLPEIIAHDLTELVG